MENQKELFPELRAEEPKKKMALPGLVPEGAVTITLTYDKLILCILGAIIIVATAFAFGFEKGKPRLKPVVTRTEPVSKPAKQKPYTILAATFKSKQYAVDAAAKLRAKGFPTVIIGINGLYEVYAGEFSDYKEANRGLAVISKIHKGCQIRKR